MSDPLTWQVLSAVATFLVAVVAIVPIFRDRRRLKVDVAFQVSIREDRSNTKVERHSPFLSVTNVGRRRIILRSWGAELEKDAQEQAWDLDFAGAERFDDYRALEEGEYFEFSEEKLGYLLAGAKRLYVEDTTGKRWKTGRRRTKHQRARYNRSLNG